MKRATVFIGVSLLFLASGIHASAQTTPNDLTAKQQRMQKLKELRERDEIAIRSKIHPEIRGKIANGKDVLVIVQLNVPLERIINPTQVDDARSRKLIAAAQDELISALGERKYRITHRYENFPLIALEVGREALEVLDASPLVLRVQENRMGKAAVTQTVQP